MSQALQTDLKALLKQLPSQLDDVMTRDKHRLQRQIHELSREAAKPGADAEAQQASFNGRLQKLQQAFERSLQLCQQRRALLPEVTYPDGLPISERRDEISEMIAKHQVVVLAGETGSGKTTQIPKICLELGRGVKGMIGHTQPRRIAARTVASRIAEELNTPLGESVGYQVRFADHSKDTTHVKLMTDGILLAEIQNDRFLNKYDTLIIDEAHERSLNIDFLLGYLKHILPLRPDLKIIITSATIDLDKFSQHFADADGKPAPVIEVSGRTYPVTTHYRPMTEDYDDQYQAISETVGEILAAEKGQTTRGGDILVFLSGEREIRETAKALRNASHPHLDILPLYARLSLAEQNKVFNSHRGRRVVLSTNVAETSLTVPGIRYVIDPGFARISRYSYRSKIQRLPIEAVSQASANQRQGRCGRVSAGICYRLYSEEDFLGRPEFTDAEITRTNLAAVILQMLNLRIGDIRDFGFVDAPDSRLINDGYNLLQELQAVDSKSKLTSMGRQLMSLPVDPKLGRMLLAAGESNCLRELLIIISALSVQDPRDRPSDKKQAADEKHRRFNDDHSDFLAYINLWEYVETQRQELSVNQWSKLCKREFLSYLRLREWREIHHQLLTALKPLKLKQNTEPASYETVHRALLPGLLGQVGNKAEDREYLGARNRRFMIFPGSSQSKKSPKWLVSGQLLETSKVFAHQVAKVEPNWVLDAAVHLVKRQQFEPHYDAKSGQVMAFERVSLYGLMLVEKARISFSQIDPVASREVFIRAALVEGRYADSLQKPGRNGKSAASGKFYAANLAMMNELHELEAKSRRRDILVDDEALYRFFDERVPAEVVNLAGFERWRKDVEQQKPNLLYLTRDHLMRHDASAITEAQFPDTLSCDGLEFKLSYHFEPNHPADGVSVQVPVAALHLVPALRLEWLIPGILREKCIALLKALPKQWRKNFVPVPSVVDKALQSLKADNTSLIEALNHQLKRQTLVQVPADVWANVELDDYYRFNIQVVDDRGRVLEQSRDLAQLREKYRDQLQQTLKTQDEGIERDDILSWDFDTFEESIKLKRAGMSISAYPALVDEGDRVSLKLRDNPVESAFETERGLCRLALLSMPTTVKYLRKELLKGKDLGLTVVDLGKREQVVDDMIMAAVRQCCFGKNAAGEGAALPKTEAEFEACLAAGREQVTARAQEIAKTLINVLAQVVAIKKAIKGNKNALAIAIAAGDINKQLQQLIYKGFIFETPANWYQQYPRYLKGMLLRLDKAPSQMQKDKVWTLEIASLSERWFTRLEKDGQALVLGKPKLLQYRWMLEEYRVSLFAQSLKTLMPVSAKRLNKLWQEAE